MNEANDSNIQMDDEPVTLPPGPVRQALVTTPEYEEGMQKRYFQAQNCRRWPELFEPFDTLGGILWGVGVTDNPQTLQLIEALMAQAKLGVTEITEEEYTRLKQKKTGTLQGLATYSPRPVPSSAYPVPLVPSDRADQATIQARVRELNGVPPPNSHALKGTGKAVVGEVAAPEPLLEAGKPVPSVAEALQVGEVEPPPTAKVRNSRKK